MFTKQDYLDVVHTFNKYNGFKIVLPKHDHVYDTLVPYTTELLNLIKDVDRYENIRKQGFSDDHLATEIGLTVLHINKISNGIKN
tara:strand:+ start:5078 stop:5332 length:255 start_codon:yes stop_codon:yes gene_type:complete